ncbi:MAG: 2-oxoacid:ferredoxin oxidoreductase subunit beta [Salinivirgaceae bacterium]|nr:2-oxoacid:ferredoxin oxidoreductase subunit beta [Salinivirgaceae bacterium]MDD4746822.1 2-oxoacid:ferredoxin oxidoreductase subunit beta [Salinivirgaceae bacterium]MDY0280862.1 2-oxoacid:ferredoxin oxidoreductase subunit beta [Salinivirgaceae bacterium]
MSDLKIQYKPADFKSDQEVRWCPGCGDHAILNSMLKAMANIGCPKEKVVVVSGIGCSSRFPYYVSTYGFHGIHGRAAAIASGLKVANPDLCVWQITGDGDAMAIGGNHFIHEIRRNINLNIVLFNNEIYGLTKGQYSPTSKKGAISNTSPFGTIERPFRPGELVMGAQGRFFARTIDMMVQLSADVLEAAARFEGAAVVEALVNCVIFNDATHEMFSAKENRDDRTIVLRHGEKMIFGKEKNKGLVLKGFTLKVVTIGEDGYTIDDILTHDAGEPNPAIHHLLSNMQYPEYPVALGVIREVKDDTYENLLVQQIADVQANTKIKKMDDLLKSGGIWEVK